MKTILALSALVAVCVANTLPAGILKGTVSIEEGSPYYQRYYEYADPEGNIHIIDVEAPLGAEAYEEDFHTRNAANNAYYLYTRRNRILSQTLTNGNANSITSSNFDASKMTIVSVHGWLGSRYAEPNPEIRSASLDTFDCNVIVLDWSRLANNPLYNIAANGVPDVGRGLGQFLRFLNQVTGARFDNMHLVGFSLGAHIVGNAGRELNGQVARVTGLDPAGPLWNYSRDRLAPGQARYVEAIHTDGGIGGLGIGTDIADADFFPNGGNSQPGCLTSLCNHSRACELFGATVTHSHHVGRRCTTSLQITWNTCIGASHPMGNHNLNKSGSGMYRLDTGRNHPF